MLLNKEISRLNNTLNLKDFCNDIKHFEFKKHQSIFISLTTTSIKKRRIIFFSKFDNSFSINYLLEIGLTKKGSIKLLEELSKIYNKKIYLTYKGKHIC